MHIAFFKLEEIDPLKGTETLFFADIDILRFIRRDGSPEGDGNEILKVFLLYLLFILEEIDPLKGTETEYCFPLLRKMPLIRRDRSPEGDGNFKR